VVTAIAGPALGASGDNPLLEPRSVTAARAGAAIRIDGALDEPAWETARPGEQFIQQGPAPGEPARLRTSFNVLLGASSRFVSHRGVDQRGASEPRSSIARSLRDQGAGPMTVIQATCAVTP
jgi:hypothetical protein